MNNIVLNEKIEVDDNGAVTNQEGLSEWIPIGTSSSNSYRGTFDGNGKTISGLYIKSTADYQGLFGYVGTFGTVKDLSVSGEVSGNRYVGGVVGYNSSIGNVKNCYNTGTVSGGEDVGGVVGDNSGIVENCYNTGTVTGPDSGTGNRVGGVVGENSGSSIVVNCYNTGTVTGTDDYVGGVVGYNHSSGSVTNCYNTGEVSGNKYVGGVVGYNDGDSTVKNCYNTGKVSGKISVGGVVGDNRGRVENCYNTGKVSGNSSVGGVVGQNEGGRVKNCYFLKDTAEKGIGVGEEIGATAESVDDLDALCKKLASDPWTISDTLKRPVLQENPEGGLGSPESPYQISTATQLKNFATAVNGGEKSAHAKLMNNIDLKDVCGPELDAETSWTPIGNDAHQYIGTFDGNGKTIKNLYINNTTSSEDQGLFGYLGTSGDNKGTVQNLTVEGSVSSTVANSNVGGVVGLNSGNVENCYNTGEVSGNNCVGGVVGYNNGSVTNCYNTGKVSNGSNVGGVVGYNNSGTVKNCYNTGNVSGGSKGGVVGYNINGGTVTNCYFLKTDDVNKDLPGIGNDSAEGAAAKDDTAFHSGEVAYLLGEAWGQTLGGEEDSLPTLVALNPDAAKEVYQLTFDWSYEGAPEGTTTTTNVYTNGSVAIPEINHDRAGYHISGWKDASGAPVTTETAVTADTTYIAEWTANTYTITVTAGSGGTVNGGGTFAEGTQVTVTATANDGYTFVAWQEGGTKIENAGTSYTFTVNDNCTLTAVFEKEPEPTPTPTPDPTPSGPSTGDSTGWDDILDELENAENGDEITIDMGDETKVPAEIFESLAGKDVDVTFDLGDIQWSASGADIPTDTDFTDLDLGVNLDTNGIPVNVINTITGEVGTVQITLAHNGEFGFTMTLTAPLGKENAGYWANLYHYKVNGGEADREDPLGDDEDAEALNFEAAAKIDEDGSVTIPFSHASQYAIVIDTHSHATVDVSDLFIDVAPNAWYKDAVQYAYDHGLMTGTSAHEFAPEATTTRAMIVSILARLEGVESAEAAGFADVDDNDWYATAVNWAASVGVVNGYEDNTFRPNQPITREQLAAILMNYAAYKGYDVSARADLSHYSDADSISSWANDVLLWAVAEGLLTGVTDDTIAPQAHATRAQVAAILQRFLSE